MSRPESPILVFAVEGMHCPSCGLLIDEYVEEVVGVTSSTTDVPRGRTVVALSECDVDPAVIVAAIAEAGYEARPLASHSTPIQKESRT